MFIADPDNTKTISLEKDSTLEDADKGKQTATLDNISNEGSKPSNTDGNGAGIRYENQNSEDKASKLRFDYLKQITYCQVPFSTTPSSHKYVTFGMRAPCSQHV